MLVSRMEDRTNQLRLQSAIQTWLDLGRFDMFARVQFPATPTDITPECLTAVLRNSGAIESSAISSVHVNVVAAGRGFAAQSAHLMVAYDRSEPDAPSAMFVKLSSPDAKVRERLRTIGLYETETGFYRDLGRDCPVRVPRVYTSLYEPSTGESLLLLEDIGHMRFGDNLAGSTLDEARVAIGRMARIQAHYWNHPRLQQCGWLRSAANDRQIMPMLYRSLLPVFEQRWGETAPKAVLDAARVLGERIEPWIESHLTGPRTLAHGDYRPDNFAFDTAGEIVVFDWQTARYDPGSRDLAYFLAFALPVETRRAHEGSLLELYYHTLLEHGVCDYGFDEVRANYRRSVGSAVVRMVTAGALLDFSSERGRQLAVALMERIGAAVEDHDFTSWGVRRAAL